MMQQPSISTYFRASKKRGRADEVEVGKLKLQAVVGGVGEDGRDLPAKKEVVVVSPKTTTKVVEKSAEKEEEVESQQQPLVKFVHKAPCSPQKKKTRMSKEEMRKLLEGKGKLKDLQKALQSINGAAKKIDALRSKATSTSSSTINPVPAYQRYSHLVEGSNSSKGGAAASPSLSSPSKKSESGVELQLPLPYKYRVLEELFRGVETVCHIMEGRSETLTLTKLREGVFSLFKKVKLSEGHFSQFLSVLPGCYKVRWEGKTAKALDLVVVRPEGVRGSRGAVFRKALQELALKYHETYLLSLDPPMEVERSKIRRWHPSFRLDAVPDVAEVPNFPARPLFDVVSNAKDVLARVKDMVAVNERMQRALYKSAAEAEKNSTTVVVPSPIKKTVDVKAVSRQLKGVSQALLDKIRAREQEKRVRSLTLSKAEVEEESLLDRLPSVVRVIHNTFVGERKAALSLDLLLERISHSCASKGSNASREWSRGCVDHLARVYPGWLTVHELSDASTFVKICREGDINELCVRIKAEKKKKNTVKI